MSQIYTENAFHVFTSRKAQFLGQTGLYKEIQGGREEEKKRGQESRRVGKGGRGREKVQGEERQG